MLDFHQIRDTLTDVADFRPLPPNANEFGHVGSSNFQYDQKRLLSHPGLENAVELKRMNYDMILVILYEIGNLQQSILTLIDAELHASR